VLRLIALVSSLSLVQSQLAPPPQTLLEEVRTLTQAQHNDARFDAVTAMLRARTIPFTVEPFQIDRQRGNEPRTTGRNIVVSIGTGTDDLVVGAHYDAVRLPDGSLSHGAVDNAASSVMLVHLAETLRNEPLPVRVRVVWFDMEELGLLGSAAYVRAHRAERIRAMLNFDVNAYGDTLLFGPPDGGDDERMQRAMVETCEAQRIECIRLAPMPPGDDRPFGQARIPTLSIAILPAGEGRQLVQVMNSPRGAGSPGPPPAVLTTIHTANDVIDKVDPGAIMRVHGVTAALVRALTNSLK